MSKSYMVERQTQQHGAKRCVVVIDQFPFMLDFVMRSNKNTSLNPFCFYNRDQTSWSADATLSLHLQSYNFVAAVTLDRLLYNLHRWGGGERTRRRGYGKDEERLLNEEHLVFTGGGTRGGFRSGGEGGYDGGKDDVWALGGVDGRVQAPGAVVLHQRDGLPVVGVQTGAQRRLVVVAAADERLACQLSAEKMGLQRGSKTWTTMHASFNLFLQLGQGSHLAFLLAHTLLVPVLKSLSWSEQKLLEITASFLSRGIECHCVLLCMESQ